MTTSFGTVKTMAMPVSNAAVPPCPYCKQELVKWPLRDPVEACGSCRRPIVALPLPGSGRPFVLVIGALQAASTAYGIATVGLVTASIITDIPTLQFIRSFALLLFVIASVLTVDGILAFRTRFDRSWNVFSGGPRAMIVGALKCVSGFVAFALCVIGLSL